MAEGAATTASRDDTSLKDLLSPYDTDRSALTDAGKLAHRGFDCRTAILIYGFDYADRPLDPAIEAFELLGSHRVQLGRRHEARLDHLVHPVHAAGRVFGWEVRAT
ncbi:MAG: hypothetical protein ICV64_00485 [Thermoleophilia bacterium]|nr:hypothetical protein [Thermoleophilia bacterium]